MGFVQHYHQANDNAQFIYSIKVFTVVKMKTGLIVRCQLNGDNLWGLNKSEKRLSLSLSIVPNELLLISHYLSTYIPCK